MFTLRFDMRLRDGDASAPALYRAAIEMAAWGEAHGAAIAMVSEHHASSDGYLPAPFVLASAMAARTTKLPIQIAALLVPLHDPIELAEQMAVLDIVSGGRVSYICALGYRPEEYAMFGRDIKQRGKRMEACLAAMKRAWRGEPFEYEGRRVRVTPRPLTTAGPALFMGGNAPEAVRRAARLGMGMLTMGGKPELNKLYQQACAEYGQCSSSSTPSATPSTCFIARDVDEAWREIRPYMLHDAAMYAAGLRTWAVASRRSAGALRRGGSYRSSATGGGAFAARRPDASAACGGLPLRPRWPASAARGNEPRPRGRRNRKVRPTEVRPVSPQTDDPSSVYKRMRERLRQYNRGWALTV
jgi:alkanesulfonate monooxygenase SsuD/methylene tetrahydromethanopterin reductase-like flavin-dependent oxidoreductase (luciferase family)